MNVLTGHTTVTPNVERLHQLLRQQGLFLVTFPANEAQFLSWRAERLPGRSFVD